MLSRGVELGNSLAITEYDTSSDDVELKKSLERISEDVSATPVKLEIILGLLGEYMSIVAIAGRLSATVVKLGTSQTVQEDGMSCDGDEEDISLVALEGGVSAADIT